MQVLSGLGLAKDSVVYLIYSGAEKRCLVEGGLPQWCWENYLSSFPW